MESDRVGQFRTHLSQKIRRRKENWIWPKRISKMAEYGGLSFSTVEATFLCLGRL